MFLFFLFFFGKSNDEKIAMVLSFLFPSSSSVNYPARSVFLS